jgi:hypothetical protein
MAKNSSSLKKVKQLSIDEYNKIKAKLAKSKLKLSFPWIIKLCFILPLAYCTFLVIYYLVQLRFIAEH